MGLKKKEICSRLQVVLNLQFVNSNPSSMLTWSKLIQIQGVHTCSIFIFYFLTIVMNMFGYHLRREGEGKEMKGRGGKW